MAVHLSTGRLAAISLLTLLGLAVAAGTAHYLSRSAPEAETVPSALVAPTGPGPGVASPSVARVAAIEADGGGASPQSLAETAIPRDPEPARPTARAPGADPILKSTGAGEPDQVPVPLAAVPPAAPELLAVEPAAVPAAIAMAPLPAVPLRAEAEATAAVEIGVAPEPEADVAAEVEIAPAATAVLTAPGAPASAPRQTPEAAPAMAPQMAAAQERVTVARLVIEPQDSLAPRDLAAPATRPRNMAPIPVRAPRAAKSASIVASSAAALAAQATAQAGARSAAQIAAKADTGAARLFQNAAQIRVKKDANLYITSRNIPENDRLLEAYSAARPNAGWVQTRAGEAAAVPGLLGIAAQARRSQGDGQGNAVYSLADAMRDAIWRKHTAARLKSLTTAQNACLEDVDDEARTAPSIGLIASC